MAVVHMAVVRMVVVHMAVVQAVAAMDRASGQVWDIRTGKYGCGLYCGRVLFSTPLLQVLLLVEC